MPSLIARPVSLAALVVAALIAGCGSGHSTATPTGAAVDPVPAGRLLVLFKRVSGSDPLASQLTVNTDGAATALITLGGPRGEEKHVFTMSPAQLQALKHRIRIAEHTNPRTVLQSNCCTYAYYEFWITVAGHSWRVQQNDVPPQLKPLIDLLNGITAARTGYA